MKIENLYVVSYLLIGCVLANVEKRNGGISDQIGTSLILQDLPLFKDQLENLRIERSLKKDGKKTKLRKRERKRKLAVAAVEKVVRETLHQEFEPMAVALQMIQTDSFSKGIVRQLSNLEAIQSKVLTEYGELRAAISEIGRHTMDLGRQVASLDERIATLDRQFHHRNKLKMSREPNTFADSTVVQADDVSTLSMKLSSAERNFKENLINLENRTLDSIKLSKTALERKMDVSDMEMTKHLQTLETTINKMDCVPPASSNSILRKGLDGRMPWTEYSFRKSVNGLDLTKNADNLERNERQHPPVITPFKSWPRPKTEYENAFSYGGAPRLASEIAKYLRMEEYSIAARDCSDLMDAGKRENGIYKIYPSACTKRYNVEVFCNMKNAGGGWTVIQRRGPFSLKSVSGSAYMDPSFSRFSPVDFFRNWADYKWGFGNLNGEYWLGNEYIHQLTESGNYKMRIELEDWNGEKRWAEYSHFSLGSETKNYSIHIGEYSGNAGNSLKQHENAEFSTRDRDNDANPRGQCARTCHGAWWFNSCHDSHLNGKYFTGRPKTYGDGINWLNFKGLSYSLKRTAMMIKPMKK